MESKRTIVVNSIVYLGFLVVTRIVFNAWLYLSGLLIGTRLILAVAKYKRTSISQLYIHHCIYIYIYFRGRFCIEFPTMTEGFLIRIYNKIYGRAHLQAEGQAPLRLLSQEQAQHMSCQANCQSVWLLLCVVGVSNLLRWFHVIQKCTELWHISYSMTPSPINLTKPVRNPLRICRN